MNRHRGPVLFRRNPAPVPLRHTTWRENVLRSVTNQRPDNNLMPSERHCALQIAGRGLPGATSITVRPDL